jgi:hypothetical protein
MYHPVNSAQPSLLLCVNSRPVRSSKKRALEQVKSWCGSMTKKEFETGMAKCVVMKFVQSI